MKVFFKKYSLLILYAVGTLFLTIYYNLDWLDFAAGLTGFLYIYYLAKRNIFNFFIGILNIILYVIICYNFKLYGEVIIYTGFDFPLAIISFFAWKKALDDDYTVAGKKLKGRTYIPLILGIAAATLLYSMFLGLIGGENNYIDALSSGVTIVATFLMLFRYREQWFMWIVVYGVSIVMWITSFNLLMIIMSAACFLNSVYGFIEWSRSAKINKYREDLRLSFYKPQQINYDEILQITYNPIKKEEN